MKVGPESPEWIDILLELIEPSRGRRDRNITDSKRQFPES